MLALGAIGIRYGKPQRLGEWGVAARDKPVRARPQPVAELAQPPHSPPLRLVTPPSAAPSPVAVYGTDYLGRTCGVDAGVASLKYTTYPRVTEDFIVNVGKSNPLDYKFYGARRVEAAVVMERGWSPDDRGVGPQRRRRARVRCRRSPQALRPTVSPTQASACAPAPGCWMSCATRSTRR
jgi:hypothetical protein